MCYNNTSTWVSVIRFAAHKISSKLCYYLHVVTNIAVFIVLRNEDYLNTSAGGASAYLFNIRDRLFDF